MTLKWAQGEGNGLDVTKYTIYMSSTAGTAGTKYVDAAAKTTVGPKLSYEYKGAAGTYYFKISSHNQIGEGLQSSAGFKALIIAPPSVPVVPNPKTVAATSVALTWEKSTGTGVTGYEVQRSNNAKATTPTWAAAGSVATDTGAFTDTTLMARNAETGKLYFRVRAMAKSGTDIFYSAWSAAAEAYACAKPAKPAMTA